MPLLRRPHDRATADVIPAASYARISRDDPANEQIRLPAQLTKCRETAAHIGAEIVVEYQDDGISGTTDERHRPGLRAVLAAAERGDIQTVIVYSLSRLARDEDLMGHLRLVLRRSGCAISSVLEPNISPLEGGLRAMIDAEYVRRGRVLVTAALRQRAAAHQYTGGTTVFGLAWQDGSRVVVPGESSRLVRAIEAIEAGASVRAAAIEIGLLPNRLANICRNPAIAGAYAYGRTRKDPSRGRYGRGRGESPRIDWGTGPEIVSPERWQRLQGMLRGSGQRSGPGSLRGSLPLSGLLRCGHCHERLYQYSANRRVTPPDRYYRCPSGHVSICDRGWAAGVMAAVADLLSAGDTASVLAAALNATWEAGRQSGHAEAELARLDRAERGMVSALASGEIPDPSAVASALAACQRQQATLRARVRADRLTVRHITPAAIRDALAERAARLRAGSCTPTVLRQIVQEIRAESHRSASVVLAWGEILPITAADRTDSAVRALGVIYRHNR